MSYDTGQDLGELSALEIPGRRAAYSDRTAWLMAVLAQLAYIYLDEESDAAILSLAKDLATLTDTDDITKRLKAFSRTLASSHCPDNDARKNHNKILRDALKVGGFELVSGLHSRIKDTQGYIAYRKPKPNNNPTDPGMIVLSFRGTESIKDWMTNINAQHQPVYLHGKKGIQGNMHQGFHDAYKSVHDQINGHLQKYRNMPLYITGHSLGGALAVIATWFQESQYLAACYTFGAPRPCDESLADKFKTPIYRIVNGPDPVTFLPTSGKFISFLVAIPGILAAIFPFSPVFGRIADWLRKQRKYSHVGDMRYLTTAKPGTEGNYPELRLEYGTSALSRLFDFIQKRLQGEAKRIDKYHKMVNYLDKLAAYARRRNQKHPTHNKDAGSNP